MASLNSTDSSGSGDINSLLAESGLEYLADNESNVVVERTQRKQHASKVSYKQNNVVVLNLNTGSDYIDFKNSTLKFRLKTFDDALAFKTGNWGALDGEGGSGGSVLNIFESIRLVSRSGSQICSIDELNMYNYIAQKVKHTYEWRTKQQGSALLGFSTTSAAVDANGTEYIIPCSMLAPFFDMDTLTPASASAI